MLIVSVLFFTVSATAQIVKDSAVYKRKHELVLNVNTNRTSLLVPSGLMYRINFKKVSLRMKLDGGYDYYNYHKTSTYDIAPSIGIQKNVNFTNNFQFYWGADLGYRYQARHSSDTTAHYLSESNLIGLSPLIGVRYYYKRMIIGLESSGGFNYVNKTNNYSVRGRQESFDFQLMNATKFYIGFTF